MFSLGNIETKRHQDIILANHNMVNTPVSKPVIQNTARPRMVDKSTMSDVTTSSVYSDADDE